MTNAALRGKPDAGNPHVRFDEGEVASAPTQDASVGQQTDALQAMMRTAGELARNGRVKVHFGAGRYVIDDYLPIYSNMSIELDDAATFRGWATTAKDAAAGRAVYPDGANVRNLATATGATVHLYAVWK